MVSPADECEGVSSHSLTIVKVQSSHVVPRSVMHISP